MNNIIYYSLFVNGRRLRGILGKPRRGTPPLTTPNVCQKPGLATSPGECRTVAGMTNHEVVIAGGGPTGMMLAAELALANVDVAVVERRETQELSGARAGAGGLHARTIEVFDQRGVAERFLSQGTVMQVAGFSFIPLDISDAPAR